LLFFTKMELSKDLKVVNRLFTIPFSAAPNKLIVVA
jgi:hypothetical protein